MKYGFATFVKSRFPNPVLPKREALAIFSKATDFREGMEGLWCYLTRDGRVAQRRTDHTGSIDFLAYDNGLAFVRIIGGPNGSRLAHINPERIFRDTERPVEDNLPTLDISPFTSTW